MAEPSSAATSTGGASGAGAASADSSGRGGGGRIGYDDEGEGGGFRGRRDDDGEEESDDQEGGDYAPATSSSSSQKHRPQDQRRELSELLGALAAGVRSVQNLPVGDEYDFERSFPEFSAGVTRSQSSLAQIVIEALRATAAASTSASSTGDGGGSVDWFASTSFEDLLARCGDDDDDDDALAFEDPALWEKCADACDALMDRVDASVQVLQQRGGGDGEGGPADSAGAMLQKLSNQARDRSRTSYQVMMDGIVDMEKPQNAVAGRLGDASCPIQNSRMEPFVPPIRSKPHALVPLSLDALVPGHGLETRYGSLRSTRKVLPRGLVAPASHVPHVYREEIEGFRYLPRQLEASEPPSAKLIPSPEGFEDAAWVDTEDALRSLASDLESSPASEVAIDLEAHSYRSFSGLTCLMQLSYRCGGSSSSSRADEPSGGGAGGVRNYLIDALALRGCLGRHLQPCLANPEVVKVMHGADSDIGWLQRDFGLYVVNLFDTGRAARALDFPSAGLAYLLRRYAGIEADKSFQLADWRQRPLPDKMRLYAIQDTCYLLDIYDRLKWDLMNNKGGGGEDLIRQVLDVSRKVCLIRYAVEPFDPDGYKVLLRSRGKNSVVTDVNDLQSNVLRRLYDWRDRMARLEDESPHYVCPNKSMVRIAMAAQTATSLRSLQSLLNPVPPLILDHAQEVTDIIKSEVRKVSSKQQRGYEEAGDSQKGTSAVKAGATKHKQAVGAPSSAFFKPNKPKAGTASRSGMMSPVLGTEALYKQAGWMTPVKAGESSATTTGDEDEDDDPTMPDQKPKRLLSVHASNKNWRATGSVWQQEESGGAGGKTVDGMGTVRAMREHSQSPSVRSSPSSIEADALRARHHAMQIRMSQKSALPAILGLVTPTIDVCTDDDEPFDDSKASAGLEGGVIAGGGEITSETMGEEDFPIPRSMRDIYKISNRNRRNKKAGSPTPERGVTPTSEKEREELAQAEALLRERGLLASPYFDDGSPGKRQRTKPLSGRDSEESVPQESTHASAASREQDSAVIQAVGWIQPPGAVAAETKGGGGYPDAGAKDVTQYGFDYSAVGAIGALDPGAQTAPNPFFSGAALAGSQGTTQGVSKSDQQRSKGKGNFKSRQNRSRQERPEKKDGGRTHSYRNKR